MAPSLLAEHLSTRRFPMLSDVRAPLALLDLLIVGGADIKQRQASFAA